MPMDVKPNQEFLKFISQAEGKNKEKRFINLELLAEMENSYPGLFASVMSNFDEVKELREGLDKDGVPEIIPWEEALKRFYYGKEYEGVTRETRDIAEVLSNKGVDQSVFNDTVELRRVAQAKGVPEHILGKSLKEETILESIETIRAQTESKLQDGMQILENLYNKKFTYEWLSKNDPTNSIMGLFVDCCGTITSSYYGSDIARASMIAHDVQNLVIRDYEGKIISKGTMYINKQQGYAVINDFELNRKYREHEMDAGRYSVDENHKDEKEREQIFQAYIRGIQAFVEEYNKQNPEKPLKQVNVGMGYNRLKRQIERYEKATRNLSVPFEYSFRDAEDEQFILYQIPNVEKSEIKNDGGIEI